MLGHQQVGLFRPVGVKDVGNQLTIREHITGPNGNLFALVVLTCLIDRSDACAEVQEVVLGGPGRRRSRVPRSELAAERRIVSVRRAPEVLPRQPLRLGGLDLPRIDTLDDLAERREDRV